MQVARLISALRLLVVLVLLTISSVFLLAQDTSPATAPQQPAANAPQQPAGTAPLPTAPVQTQQPKRFELKDYTKAPGYFPNPLAPYSARTVPPPDLSNTPRLESLLRDGKLYISMDDAVALALENNLDIAIQRYNMNIADTDILRAKAGSSILGINSGIVQGTPGGGVGGLGGQVGSGQGGTTVGAGGAGTGTGGLVSSTLGSGPLITSFDPIITGTLQLDRLRTICTSPFCGNNQNTGTANLSYVQGFQTGTNMLVGFNNTRVTSNSPFTIYSPSLNSSFKFQLSQHLLQGFGFAP